MLYEATKIAHVATAVINFALFALRWIWMLRESPLRQHPVVRRMPMIVDTLLLISGIILCVIIGQYPFVDAWLTAVVALLAGYIVAGTIALKRGRTKALRVGTGLIALCLVAGIFSIALTKNPNPLALIAGMS